MLATLNAPYATRSTMSPKFAPDASTILVPDVAVKSVPTRSFSPFKYASTYPTSYVILKVVWLAVAT